MTDNAMLEKCAWAIGEVRVKHLGGSEHQLPSDRLFAEAVIRALLEPTPEMVNAGEKYIDDHTQTDEAGAFRVYDAGEVFQTMLRTLLPEEPRP